MGKNNNHTGGYIMTDKEKRDILIRMVKQTGGKLESKKEGKYNGKSSRHKNRRP